jgi:hypothetical protein
MVLTTSITQFVRPVSDANHFYPPFLIGYLSFDFGPWFIAVAMPLLGAALGILYRTLVLTSNELWGRALYAYGVGLSIGFFNGAASHTLAKLMYTGSLVVMVILLADQILPSIIGIGRQCRPVPQDDSAVGAG